MAPVASSFDASPSPIADATHTISEIAFLVAEVVLESGVTGEGYLLSFHYSPHAIEGAMKDARDALLAHGYHACETGRFLQDIAGEHEYFGNNGLQKWAAATLNGAAPRMPPRLSSTITVSGLNGLITTSCLSSASSWRRPSSRSV